MPNTAGSPATDLSGSGDQAAVVKPRSRDGGEHALFNYLSRGASAAPGGSNNEGQRPRTCPVTHSREQFYTVCSDYALVNQAACLYHSSKHSAPAALLVQSHAEGQDHSSSSITCEGDSAIEDVTASHTKPVLVWEIDTTDFDTVLIRMKSWTGNLKTGFRKIKASDKHCRNLQEFPQQATLEEIKQKSTGSKKMVLYQSSPVQDFLWNFLSGVMLEFLIQHTWGRESPANHPRGGVAYFGLPATL